METRLPATLQTVCEFFGVASFLEVIVVDDGSTDGTAALVEEFARTHPVVRLLRNPGNRGKGYAVRSGMLAARGEWVLFTDSDLSSPIEEFGKLTEAALRTGAEIAIGSRALDRSLIGVHQPFLREYAGRFFNVVMRLATGLPFYDTQCGFKLFQAEAARAVFSRVVIERFGFDVEALYIARKLGLHAVEVPVRWNDVAGSKVSMFSGLDGFVDLLRIRWNARQRRY